MKTVVIVQARTASSRLPGKVLLPAVGRTLLEHQLERIRGATSPFELVVATTPDAGDRAIFEACRRADVACLSGHPTDLLERHLTVAHAMGADVVVKIPSDCPLIDPQVIDTVLARYRQAPADVDYVSNLHPASYPDGNDVEVISLPALEAAFYEATRPFEREHTTPFVWERPQRFRIENVVWGAGDDLSMTHRWTLDYLEDYQFIRAVYERLWSPERPLFSMSDILRLLDEDPRLAAINARYCGVNWYRHHLGELSQVRPTETRHPAPAPAPPEHRDPA